MRLRSGPRTEERARCGAVAVYRHKVPVGDFVDAGVAPAWPGVQCGVSLGGACEGGCGHGPSGWGCPSRAVSSRGPLREAVVVVELRDAVAVVTRFGRPHATEWWDGPDGWYWEGIARVPYQAAFAGTRRCLCVTAALPAHVRRDEWVQGRGRWPGGRAHVRVADRNRGAVHDRGARVRHECLHGARAARLRGAVASWN